MLQVTFDITNPEARPHPSRSCSATINQALLLLKNVHQQSFCATCIQHAHPVRYDGVGEPPFLQRRDVGVTKQATPIGIGIRPDHKGAGWQGLEEMPKPCVAANLKIPYQDAAHIQPCIGLPSALQRHESVFSLEAVSDHVSIYSTGCLHQREITQGRVELGRIFWMRSNHLLR